MDVTSNLSNLDEHKSYRSRHSSPYRSWPLFV